MLPQNTQSLKLSRTSRHKTPFQMVCRMCFDKCFVLSINQSNLHQSVKYIMNDVTLSTVNEVKYLGIFLAAILSWDKQIRYITANPGKLTGLIQRTVGHSVPENVLQQLYSSIVMPQLEYATPVWNSLLKSQIQTL